MATEIKLPELGENLTGGDVLDIKVAPGDVVREGQTLLEVEAEKSTVEVPSPLAGKVKQLLVQKGQSIQVGQTLCTIEPANGLKTDGARTARVRQAPSAETEPEPRGAARAGEEPEQPQEQERQVAAALRSNPEVTERKPAGESAQKAAGNQGPRRDGAVAGQPTGDGRRQGTPRTLPATGPEAKPIPAGPATRRLARELGIDLGQVRGTAPGGRVTQEDVKTYVRELSAGTALPAGRPVQPPPLPDFTRWGEVERQPFESVRRRTAEQVSFAWNLIPHVTQHDVSDITELEAFRKQQEGRGPKLTVTAFALKAAAIALREFPRFNSSLDSAAGQLVIKRYYHLGVAVDTDRGLLVPVLRDVEQKSVQELAQELGALAERTRQRQIQVEELRGGTFTITNLGGIGGTGFTPIINFPEVAILGLSRSRLQPVVRDGQVVPRLLLPLSLSYDHRVIDGADAARFTRRIAELLENPLVMLLHA
jgi:pyruvate dehydrogenase E2 component (dihydrolipoamide acetyltransferase)